MGLLIGDLFRRSAANTPGCVAASMGDRELSYADIDRTANRVAHRLLEQGIARGDRVLWWGDTSLEVVPVFAALAKLGAVFAPLNAHLGVDEAEDVARLARARLLIASPSHAELAVDLAKRAGLPAVATLGPTDVAAGAVDLLAEHGDVPATEPPVSGLDERDPHVIFFTSGSTGRPKGVVLSHRVNHLRTAAGNFGDPERVVCMFPLFHMAGWTLALGAWQSGGEIVFVRSASAEELLDAAERRRATRLYCIPAVWARILATDFSARDLSSLTQVDTGTSATPPELVAELKRRFPGARTRIAYGSTEAGSGARLADEDLLRKPGSVGLPPPGVDLRIGEGGEVCLRSETMMDGYFDDPEATARALVDGWYHTGDVGVLDDEGYLSIVGRVRDIIRTGGETVGPGEVEDALRDHPGVAEVAVVGIVDPQWGEVVCAVIVAASGGAPTLDELSVHCEGRLARFKRPRRLEVVEALPRTAATGQVQRSLLVERILASG